MSLATRREGFVNEDVAKCEFSLYTVRMEQNFQIKQATFVTSAGLSAAYPNRLPCEIAVVGKSNVGKSSLINSLCRNHKLARISQQPGKTRLINFFLINHAFYLVDLPGYGFAKASKTEQQTWGALMEAYLGSGRVDHLFLLLDIRHAPTADDVQMFRYLMYYGIPYTLIATKADKLTRGQRKIQANANAKLLGAPPYAIPYSAETGDGQAELLLRIGQIWADHTAEKDSAND